MDAPLHGSPTFPAGIFGDPAAAEPSSSRTVNGPQSTLKRKTKKKKKKKQSVVSDSASFDSSSNFSSAASYSQKGIKIARNPKRILGRKNAGLTDVDALGLPLGMSIAALVAQVLDLERKNAVAENMSVDYLYAICGLAVRESLGNVFGCKFDNFVTNFETSFRSTLMTLNFISGSSQKYCEQLQREKFGRCSCSMMSNAMPHNKEPESCARTNSTDIAFESSPLSSHYRIEDPVCPSSNIDGSVSFPDRTSTDRQCHTNLEMVENVTSRELVLHDKRVDRQLSCVPRNEFSMLSTIERSVVEQTRSNDLKAFEIGLIMKKMQLKERELELNSNANILERIKLSMGVSKASFKAEKFKTQLQDTRQLELLKKCLDLLVGGLIIMLFSLAYGTYVYSHRRIVEASEACSPYKESKSSWWMPNAMSSFNSGLQLLKCQVQVFSRMLFGIAMIGAIAGLLIRRSASSHQAMPVTFILLLLGVGCGGAGKFCIDTLGGRGIHWLIYWEALCSLHFFSNIFHSKLYVILNGPIEVVKRVDDDDSAVPFWMRKLVFYSALLVLPLLCGLLPFASFTDWCEHFLSRAGDYLLFEDVV